MSKKCRLLIVAVLLPIAVLGSRVKTAKTGSFGNFQRADLDGNTRAPDAKQWRTLLTLLLAFNPSPAKGFRTGSGMQHTGLRHQLPGAVVPRPIFNRTPASVVPLSAEQKRNNSKTHDISNTTMFLTPEDNNNRANRVAEEPDNHDISDTQTQGWSLMAVAEDALKGQHFIAAFGLALAAAVAFSNVEVARAALSPDGLPQQVGVAAAASLDWGDVLGKAANKALVSGKAGASASIVQVMSLMWLNTATNYQYRYGGDLQSVLQTLHKQGGLARLYQGLPFALIQGPLTRFGDVAANVGILALLDSIPETTGVPLPVKTAAASFTSGLWRILCMPVDTSKSVSQVEGEAGFEKLKQKVLEQGPGPLYQGSFATASGSIASNYPWFLTYGFLDRQLPPVSQDDVLFSLARAALLGVSASCVADTVTNSLKVIKITQQTASLNSDDHPSDHSEETGNAKGRGAEGGENSKDAKGMSIAEALTLVLETDGIKGLFGRGLKTKLLSSAIQGSVFSVLWKYFETSGAVQ